MYYPICKETETIFHTCNPCGEVEKGRVRSLVMLAKSAAGKQIVDKANEGTFILPDWKDAIDDGTINIIPETSGSYDGGSPTTGDGYGDETERLISRLHTLNAKDPSFVENQGFWEIAEQQGFYVMFRTESLLHVVDKPVKVQASAPVEEGLDTDVVWNIAMTWSSLKKPKAVKYDAIEELFISGCIAQGSES